MRVHDTSFIAFDGTPVTGRVPTQVRTFGDLTSIQAGMVRHAYAQFRSAVLTSVTGYMVQNRTLMDGSVVRMESMADQDVVTVWPRNTKERLLLPHGFLVLSAYSDPGFFCRNLIGEWTFVSLFIPQAQELTIHGTNQFIHDLTAGELVAHPSVLVPNFVWDFASHSLASQDAMTPIVTKNEDGGRNHLPHLAKENIIKDASGATVFTMADDVPWWAYIDLADWYKNPRGDNYFRPVYVKPVTDTAGTVCLMNGFRLHTTFLQYELHSVQSQSVALKLEDDATYTPTYTNNVFNPPLLGATTPIEETVTSMLDGDLPATDFNLSGINFVNNNLGSGWYPVVCCPATSFALPGGYFGWNYNSPMWYVPQSRTLTHAGPVSFTAGEPVFASSYTRRFEYAHGPEVVIHDVAMVPVSTGYVKARLINRISYPSSWFMRAGYVTVMAENLSGAWDYYGVEGRRIDRRDSQAAMNATPRLTLEMGDLSINLFEGTATASLTGHWYRDWDIYRTSATVKDWDSHGQVIVYPHDGVSPPPVATGLGQSTYIGAGYQAIFEGAMWSREEIDAASWGVASRAGATSPFEKTRDEFEPPENTAAYHYKSRYIIDCDTRAKFVVSLLVEVISTGAKWIQSTAQGAVVGDLAVDTHPTCTVNIYAECVYNGRPAVTKLLLTGGFTRWSMEYKTGPSQNPYQYGGNDPPAMYTWSPPEVSPPLWFYRQLQNLATCQSGNTHFAAQDIIANQPEGSISPTGLDWTDASVEEPLTKLATGLAYTRVFRIGDFAPDALWLLRDLKIDADETGNYVEGMPKWHYLPEFGAKLESEYHVISILDGVFEDWTTVIPPKLEDGAPVPVPEPKDRNIKLYRI